jgi:ABC-type lipoprotein export system ATPase subunit
MIRINDISKSYRSGRGVAYAVSNVSFSIEAGKILTVVGKSGSGKTTLLNCIGGFERPDSGSIVCFGTTIHELSEKKVSLFRRRNMGFVFQAGNLLSYLTVFENISLPLMMNGTKGKKIEKRVFELLERIGLPDVAPAMPYELSGGEAQRVSVARAIAHYPKILLADEPTANLDSDTGLNLIELMLSLGRNQGCTIIISTHDTDLIKLSDNTLNLLDGRGQGKYL